MDNKTEHVCKVCGGDGHAAQVCRAWLDVQIVKKVLYNFIIQRFCPKVLPFVVPHDTLIKYWLFYISHEQINGIIIENDAFKDIMCKWMTKNWSHIHTNTGLHCRYAMVKYSGIPRHIAKLPRSEFESQYKVYTSKIQSGDFNILKLSYTHVKDITLSNVSQVDLSCMIIGFLRRRVDKEERKYTVLKHEMTKRDDLYGQVLNKLHTKMRQMRLANVCHHMPS